MEATRQRANRRTAVKLLAVTFLMFGFGYALVPLYSVFCEITGLNGKTGRLSAVEAAQVQVDLNRTVTVECVTSVNAGMPWEFRPPARKITVHPGVETTVEFEAKNYAQFPVTGKAVPSVAPNEAARYFNKTECFCFTQQSLEPGESRKMPVRFVVDPRLPERVEVLTLAYTFFESVETAEAKADKQRSPRS